jgi:hypothetical protein
MSISRRRGGCQPKIASSKDRPNGRQRGSQSRSVAQREQHFQAGWSGFWASAAGQARHAFNVGDHVFQYHVDVMNQDAIIVAMVGSNTRQSKADATSILNSVCREGWELVNGDFVFVMRGQQSRDKFMSSGQNVAVAGTVMGYYLFKRCEQNRVPETEDELRARLMPETHDEIRTRLGAA